MSRIPDFARVDFAEEPVAAPSGAAEPWITPEGIAVAPVYGPDDVAGLDFLNTYPGIPPYLRGPYPTMYVTQPWTIRQYAGFSTAEDSNAFYRRNLAAGQKGHAKLVEGEPNGVAWVVLGVTDEVVEALDAGKPSPYRVEARVGDEWISTVLVDTGCRIGRRSRVAVS